MSILDVGGGFDGIEAQLEKVLCVLKSHLRVRSSSWRAEWFEVNPIESCKSV